MTDGDKATETLEVIQDPSTHKDDTWAIFTAPDGKSWNLSKVAIHIPNNNKGTNDNDEAGIVNKEISIAVGNDINNLKRVKTFTDLGEVSELEYILPDFEETKYIAVICNLNPYFYPSLAEVEAYEQFAATGIENIENRPSASAVNGIYTINGMKINTLQKGINIIKMADGTTRKVVIK